MILVFLHAYIIMPNIHSDTYKNQSMHSLQTIILSIFMEFWAYLGQFIVLFDMYLYQAQMY